MSEPGAPIPAGARERFVLPSVLVVTMTASSFQLFTFAVLAVEIIDDLAISRTALGVLGSLNTLVGALSAPATGRFTDRIGPSRALVIVLAVSGIGMAALAMAGNWVLLGLAAIIGGVPQGWGNPVTNALIAERVPARARGTITGIKQSGVQISIFLAGLTLPGLALVVGWRGAMWGYAVLFGLCAVAVAGGILPPHRATDLEPSAADPVPGGTLDSDTEPDQENTDRANGDQPLPRVIWLVTAYALALGTAGGAIGRFFPLWANEEVGLSTVWAGALVALSGLLGIGTRIVAGRLAEHRIAPPRLLSILALVGASFCVILLLTTTIGAWILVPAMAINAIGIAAWNAVAMLAVIVSVPAAVAGRASGIVMVGFLGGLTIGSPLAGAVVDRFGSYQPVWAASLVLCAVGAAVINPGSVLGRTLVGDDVAGLGRIEDVEAPHDVVAPGVVSLALSAEPAGGEPEVAGRVEVVEVVVDDQDRRRRLAGDPTEDLEQGGVWLADPDRAADDPRVDEAVEAVAGPQLHGPRRRVVGDASHPDLPVAEGSQVADDTGVELVGGQIGAVELVRVTLDPDGPPEVGRGQAAEAEQPGLVDHVLGRGTPAPLAGEGNEELADVVALPVQHPGAVEGHDLVPLARLGTTRVRRCPGAAARGESTPCRGGGAPSSADHRARRGRTARGARTRCGRSRRGRGRPPHGIAASARRGNRPTSRT